MSRAEVVSRRKEFVMKSYIGRRTNTLCFMYSVRKGVKLWTISQHAFKLINNTNHLFYFNTFNVAIRIMIMCVIHSKLG